MFPIQAFLLVPALLAGTVSASFQSKRLDCSAVTDIVPLARYKDLCVVVHELGQTEAVHFNPANRLDIVEMCTCNLLRHQLVWDSMITHEVDSLFLAARGWVASRLPEGTQVQKDHIMFTQDERGNDMFFWDSFNKVLRSVDVETEGSEASDELMDQFANIYYNPESFTMPFKTKKAGISSLLKLTSAICKQLRGQFDTYFTYFKNLKELSGNPRFFYRIASYDENLYKLFSVRNVCEFMSFTNSLIY